MKKTIKQIILIILFLGMSGAIGFFIGYNTQTKNYSFLDYFFLLTSLIIFFIIHIIIHEIGHGLFGKFSGYKFVSFRIFSFIWIREKQGNISFRRLNIPGTLGQCLMVPPAFKTGKFPFRLYLLGGVIMNFLTSCIIGIFFHTSPFALLFVWIGLLSFLFNLLPLGFNDGMSIKMANINDQQKYLLYLQLEVNYQFSIGNTYTELPTNYYEMLPTEKKSTYFNDWQAFLRLGYLLEKRDWLTYEIEINRLWQRKDTLILPYQLELKKELLFFLTIHHANDSRIAELWHDRSLQTYIKQPLLSNTRIKASYYHFIQQQTVQALNALSDARTKNIQEVNLGSFKLETQLNHWLEQLICSSQNKNQED